MSPYLPGLGARVRVIAVHPDCIIDPCVNDPALGDEIVVTAANACHENSDYGSEWVLVNYLVCRVEPVAP